MNSLEELVTDASLYENLRSECEQIFDTSKRLPDFVFRRTYFRYCAISYDYIASKEFGYFLAGLSKFFQEKYVNYMTLEPDPVDYYNNYCSFFGLAHFSVESVGSRYIQVMSRNRSPDSFLYRGGDVGVFWGSNLRWGIFCDRISWELAVVALPAEIEMENIIGDQVMGVTELREYMLGQYHWNESVATDFMKKFPNNYQLEVR